MIDPTVLDHALFGIMALFALYSIVRGQSQLKDISFTSREKIVFYWSNGGVLWIATIATIAVWTLSERSLAALGLTTHQNAPVTAAVLAAGFLLLFTLDTWFQVSTPARKARQLAHFDESVPYVPTTRRECAHFSFLSITAGITEEIMFRGFIILYLTALLGTTSAGLVAAIAIPALLFTLMHRHQGWKAGVRIFALAVWFGTIFIITESLLIPIILHAALDIAAGIVSYRLAADRLEPTPV